MTSTRRSMDWETPKMRVLIAIVNYRTPQLAIDCLRTLAPEVGSLGANAAHVVLVDNASPDDSVPRLRDAIDRNGWNDWCTLVPLPRNGGFAYGNNEAIRFAQRKGWTFEFVYLLNPDTLVLEGAVRELLGFMERHPLCGIAGGRAENPDGSVRRTAFRFHSLPGEVEGTLRIGPVSRVLRPFIVAPPVHHRPTPVGWVSGASMMIRHEVLADIGLLDEKFFMYYEETDFCLRAADAGWQRWYVPSSRIVHLVGQSSGVTGTQRSIKRRPRYWFESRHHYFRKHFGGLSTLVADLLWLINYPVGRLWQWIKREPRVDPPWLWWDFLRYNTLSWLGARS